MVAPKHELGAWGGERNARYWSPFLILSEDMTDRTKGFPKGFVVDKLIHLELFAPLERRDHHVGRIL